MRTGWPVIGSVLILAAGVSFGATRLAVRGVRGIGSAPQEFAMLQNYLDVTPDQRKALADIDARYGSARPALRDRVWQTRDELIAALQDPNSTRKQALDRAKRFCEAQQALQLNTVEYMVELRGRLTAAQKAKLAGMVGRGMCTLTGGPCPHGIGGGMGGAGGGVCGGCGRRGGAP
jgi:Spy/CpxP family protein refolding chaperone